VERRRTAFGDWLKARRAEHNLTQQQLAEMIGTAKRSTISHWENYGETPNTESLLALARVFGEEPRMLFELASVVPPNDIPAPSLLSARPDFIWVPILRDFNAPHSDNGDQIPWVPDQLISSRDEIFAVRVPNDRLAPQVVRGDVLIAVKDQRCGRGDVVVMATEHGMPDMWRLEQFGQAWWLCNAAGQQHCRLDRSKLQGVVLALGGRPRQAMRWGVLDKS
jgi:transcriptional regulator with XRE-family HTH domain